MSKWNKCGIPKVADKDGSSHKEFTLCNNFARQNYFLDTAVQVAQSFKEPYIRGWQMLHSEINLRNLFEFFTNTTMLTILATLVSEAFRSHIKKSS